MSKTIRLRQGQLSTLGDSDFKKRNEFVYEHPRVIKSEKDLQMYIKDLRDFYAPEYPELNLLHHIPNGEDRDGYVAKQLKEMGVVAGVWDYFLPIARCGFGGLYAETKFKNNDLTEEQKIFRKYVLSYDEKSYLFTVWRDTQTAEKELLNYLKGKWK